MHPAVAFIAHFALFWLGAYVLSRSPVAFPAWVGLYVLGAICLLAVLRSRLASLRCSFWLRVAVYAALLSAIFFGADFALDTLGNSVKPRLQGSAFPGGLELYHVLCPGVVSVAAAAVLASLPGRQAALGGPGP
jgi:hypothetical protein